EPAAPREADWSKLPPPPVRKTEPTEISAATEAAVVNDRATAAEVMAWMQMAPGDANTNDVAAEEEQHPTMTADLEELPTEDYQPTYDFHAAPRRSKWIYFGIAGLALIIAGTVMLAIYYNTKGKKNKEIAMAAEADRAINENRFKDAQKRYAELVQ